MLDSSKKFEFIINGTPVSQQTRRRERLKKWKIYVREEAEKLSLLRNKFSKIV